MEEHIHRECEALAGCNRIITERSLSLHQEPLNARRLRQTLEELQVSLRNVISVRDRYRMELQEGPVTDLALRRQIETMHGRMHHFEEKQRAIAQENGLYRAESDRLAAQLHEARHLLDHSEKNANILDRTSKIQAGELASMGIAENRLKTELQPTMRRSTWQPRQRSRMWCSQTGTCR